MDIVMVDIVSGSGRRRLIDYLLIEKYASRSPHHWWATHFFLFFLFIYMLMYP